MNSKNCRFCGNFIPNGSESCPVCGRNEKERPISELLAESKKTSVVAAVNDDEQDKKPARKLRTSLILPMFTILAGGLGWVYVLYTGILGNISSAINEIFNAGGSSAPGSDSAFAVGEAVTQSDAMISVSALVNVGIVALVSLVLLIGVVSLFVRIVNRFRVGSED